MDDSELQRLLRASESDRSERKSRFNKDSKDAIREAVCAFANDLPGHGQEGVVFIGVNDDGSTLGIPITDELLCNLADIRSDGNILPFPELTVQKKSLAGAEIAVVVVKPSLTPPVRYEGRVWIRVGPSCRIATPAEEQRLAEKRRAGDLPFDVRPVSSASLSDLDLMAFERMYLPVAVAPDVLAMNQRTTEQQLMAMRLATTESPATPTVLGVLVLGKEPTFAVPGAYIQFLRVDGTELTDPIKDQKELAGPLIEVLRSLDDLFRVHIKTGSDAISATTEVRRPDFPLVALQQIARNAVMHRDYENSHAPVRITWFSDRIEMHNPGGPYGQVTRANFGQPGVTDYRNPHLAAALKDVGYVQRFGSGIPLAKKALAANGNPEVEFDVEDNYVVAIIRSKS